jgi:NAD(P)-dependent dehydrogenase (short-subunit alcohol dehydrogenase family)
MFATNHLGPFVLTALLLPRLHAAPAARILTLTPPATMTIAVEEMHAPHPFRAVRAFRISKSATLLCTYELAHRLAGSSVAVNALYPGLVKTPLLREAPAPLRWLTALAGQPPEAVAPGVVYYASAPDVEGMTGMLFRMGRPPKAAGPSPTERTMGQRLWAASLTLVGLEDCDSALPVGLSA